MEQIQQKAKEALIRERPGRQSGLGSSPTKQKTQREGTIDSLEIISAIDEEYGVPMTGVGKEHFKNIDALAAYVVAHAEQ